MFYVPRDPILCYFFLFDVSILLFRPQLYDILGYTQTFDAHEAVMKKLHFDDEKHEELSERYLWALSTCSQPNPDIITDLLKRYKNSNNISEKIKETLLYTIASMTYRMQKLTNSDKIKVSTKFNLKRF